MCFYSFAFPNDERDGRISQEAEIVPLAWAGGGISACGKTKQREEPSNWGIDALKGKKFETRITVVSRTELRRLYQDEGCFW